MADLFNLSFINQPIVIFQSTENSFFGSPLIFFINPVEYIVPNQDNFGNSAIINNVSSSINDNFGNSAIVNNASVIINDNFGSLLIFSASGLPIPIALVGNLIHYGDRAAFMVDTIVMRQNLELQPISVDTAWICTGRICEVLEHNTYNVLLESQSATWNLNIGANTTSVLSSGVPTGIFYGFVNQTTSGVYTIMPSGGNIINDGTAYSSIELQSFCASARLIYNGINWIVAMENGIISGIV